MHRNRKVSKGTKVSLMEQNLIDIYDLIEHAIDNAFEGKMNLKFYDYLKDSKIKKHEVDAFINSTTSREISDLTTELDEYIKGGNKQLREAYGHLGKPKARKIKTYLQSVLSDACRYEHDRRPGRKKRTK